jgi:hypothetical protein
VGSGLFWACIVGTFTANTQNKMIASLQLLIPGTRSRLFIENARVPTIFAKLQHALAEIPAQRIPVKPGKNPGVFLER